MVSPDAIDRQPLVVTVVAGTAASNVTRDYTTNVRVTAAESGLPRDTVFLCFQVRSVDPARFADPRTGRTERAGRIGPARMAEVDAALRRALAL